MNCVAIPANEEKLTVRTFENERTPKKTTVEKCHLSPERTVANMSNSSSSSKSKSLQRNIQINTRSAEKERVDRRTSRGLTSCLRGERDEFAEYCQAHPYVQTLEQIPQTHSVSREEITNITLDMLYDSERSRSECKSKTLPRIHFDASINDISLNEGKIV